MLDAPEPQQWFVRECLRADILSHDRKTSLGDALYMKNLLQKVAKWLSQEGRVMEDDVADVMGEADGLVVELVEREKAGAFDVLECETMGREWLNKVYIYGKKGDVVEVVDGVVRIASHTNMFAGSTGCFEWDAGYLLCEFVLNNVSLFSERTVVEIGCGTGMVGVVLGSLKRDGVLVDTSVLCTDGDTDTVRNCEANLRANEIDENLVSCSTWSWEDGLDGFADRGRVMGAGRAVCCVGADLLYDPEIIPVIVPLMSALLREAPEGSCVYLSTRRRSEETLAKFLRAVEAEEGLALEDVSGTFWDQARASEFVSFHHVRSLEEAKRDRSVLLHRLVNVKG